MSRDRPTLELAGPQQYQGAGTFVGDAGCGQALLQEMRLGTGIEDHPPRPQGHDILHHSLAALGTDVEGEGMHGLGDGGQAPDHRNPVDVRKTGMYGQYPVAQVIQQPQGLVGVSGRFRAGPEDRDAVFGGGGRNLHMAPLGCVDKAAMVAKRLFRVYSPHGNDPPPAEGPRGLVGTLKRDAQWGRDSHRAVGAGRKGLTISASIAIICRSFTRP